MTNREITDIYLKHKKKKRISEPSEAMTALLPFFIMDACYQLYSKYISPMECTFLLKKHKKEWSRNYQKFNKDFFYPFNDDETDFIVDKMDSFGDYISNYLKIGRAKIMNALRQEDLPFETREILATCMMCNILAQSAQCIWQRVYQNKLGEGEVNYEIQGVAKASIGFMDAYHHSSRHIDLNECPEVVEAVDVLCKKIVQWLAEDYKQQK